MMKFFSILAFILFMGSSEVRAYDFSEINKLYELLENTHASSINFKDISVNGAKTINSFDKDFRLFCSDTKAYLYYKNNLVKMFNFPNKEDDSLLWRDVLKDILMTYSEYSLNEKNNKHTLELVVMKNIAKNIDKYSRLESAYKENNKLNFSIENNVIHISSNVFYKGLADDIKRIVLDNKNADGLILDLRNNKGGNFAEAIKVSDLFLDNSLIVYSIENEKTNYYNSSKGDILENKKIVLLVNNNTASAAEIVVAALGEQSRATVIGTKTYGKGSIQSVYHIDKNNFFVTTGIMFTPSGKEIDKVGILPQICTGIGNSCQITDNRNTSKDVTLAINLIKSSLG